MFERAKGPFVPGAWPSGARAAPALIRLITVHRAVGVRARPPLSHGREESPSVPHGEQRAIQRLLPPWASVSSAYDLCLSLSGRVQTPCLL